MASASVSFIDSQLRKEREYWLQKLAHEPVVTGIPLDFKRPPKTTVRDQSIELAIDEETQNRLGKVCGENLLLTFAAGVAAIKVCLYQYTRLEDVIIGTAIHQQYRQLTPDNKILVLRDHVSGDHAVRKVLEQVLQTITEAYAHQRFSFNRLLQHLNIGMPSNRAPLFNVVALLENINQYEDVSRLHHDATVVFAVRDGLLSGVIEYSGDLFRPETIRAFAQYLATTLREMMARPDAKVSELQLLSENKKRELVFAYNDTACEFPREQTLAQLFEVQAEQTPNSVALVFEAQTLTYRQLNERVNQLARMLRRLGVGPGTLVGIYLEHSFETVIGILGVLKTGAAYVPLEPRHPPSRTVNAGISILLTQEALADRVRDQVSIVICLDSDWESAISFESMENPNYQTKPDDLAYVIFTSGSTGTPKGVEITNAALVNYVWWAKNTYLRGANLDFPLYSSLAFDLTVTSLFVPLIAGQRLLVYRWKENEFSLSAVLDDNQAGIVKVTPSHLALLKDRDNRRSSVQRIIVGGEALETDLALKVWNSFGGEVEIYNEYGPTEATVGCIVHVFNPLRDTRGVVPIGKPAANTQIFLLDENLNPVPENMPGEIYVAGDGLARGYLNNQQQTAERFVDNPFLPGRKMYRTGDVGRWLPESTLEYVGRNDEQVKFHGYRLELNEVRTLLNQHSQVRDSVVLLLKDNNGNDVLVAYYVSDQELANGALRAILGRHLAEETIPNFFVHLTELPLTSSGKIDRHRLPTLEDVRQHVKLAFVAPRTPTEHFIAETWCQVLSLPKVGINDNFFELGGHSLLAYQVISRINEAYQIEIQMRSIFDTPTIADLALAVTKMQMEQEDVDDLTRMIEEIKLLSGDELEKMLEAKVN